MTKNKKMVRVALPVFMLGLAFAGTGIASAHGMAGFGGGMGIKGDPAQLFTQQAALLGVSVNEVKNAWASGKDLMTLAKEKGINEQTLRVKMKAEHEVQMKTHLDAQVKAGTITQTQADAMIANKAKKDAEMDQIKATALGISVADLVNYQSAGKTVADIIKEKGLNATTVHKAINSGMQTARIAEETTRIQEMVTKGIITQEQANKRIETMKTAPQKGNKKMGDHKGGMRPGGAREFGGAMRGF